MKAHTQQAHDFMGSGETFACRLCDSLFSNLKARGNHVTRDHPGAAQHECTRGCGFGGDKKKWKKSVLFATLRHTHLSTHHLTSSHNFNNGQKVFRCGACPALFSNMKSRGMHVQRAHPTAALHTCALGCGFESDNSKTNLNHDEKAHVDGPDAVIRRICEIIYTNSRMPGGAGRGPPLSRSSTMERATCRSRKPSSRRRDV